MNMPGGVSANKRRTLPLGYAFGPWFRLRADPLRACVDRYSVPLTMPLMVDGRICGVLPRRSSVGPEGPYGIHAGGPPGREVAGQQGHTSE